MKVGQHALGKDQFGPVGYLAVAVAVEHKQAIVGTRPSRQFSRSVAVIVEPRTRRARYEFDTIAVEVEHNRRSRSSNGDR